MVLTVTFVSCIDSINRSINNVMKLWTGLVLVTVHCFHFDFLGGADRGEVKAVT